jgi:hypothetical protein
MTQQTRKPGDVLQRSYQSDVYGGRYRLVESLGGGRWVIEDVEPSDEEMDAILSDPYFITGGVYIKPNGEALFPETPEEVVLARIDCAGRRSEIRLVSPREFSRYF